MTLKFILKAIKPARLRVDRVRNELLSELQKEAEIIRKEYEKTVRTWDDPPRFEVSASFKKGAVAFVKGDASALVGPTGSQKQVNKFLWLDKGTRIRWALMSKDWRSKTRPGSLSSGPGGGRVVVAGRRAMQSRNIAPRPGIQARNWTTLIAQRRKRPFQRAMVKAMQKGASKAFQ